MLTIGEFSQATRLTVKALRIYHDEGLLVPERIDPANGYRYYGEESFKRARAIGILRELGFSLAQMKEVLSSARDDDDLTRLFRERLTEVDRELIRLREVRERIRYFAENGEDEASRRNLEISEREVDPFWACSIRYQGAYGDIGTRFSEIFRRAGRYASGKPFAVYYDLEYRDSADIEAAIPVKKEVSLPGIECRLLAGGRFLSIVHRGPYALIGSAYKALFEAFAERSLEVRGPIRERYLKGPGMIFPRDPERFVTEVMAPL
jgi:DNA-binding transcriptional MerR regulator/DNA gyrase inhibitor GyrI